MKKEVQKYKENPFMLELSEAVMANSGFSLQPVRNRKTGMSFYNESTQKLEGSAIFAREKHYDRETFVKVYSKGIGALLELKASGIKVFRIIYNELLNHKNQLSIALNYELLDDDAQKLLSKRTFERGLKECIDKRIIAKSVIAGYYFVNPTYVYNGDRVYVLQQYILDEEAKFKDNTQYDNGNLIDIETGEVLG